MQIVRNLYINKQVVSGLLSIDDYLLSFSGAAKRTVTFIASGMVRTESGLNDDSIFHTGFYATENTSIWAATSRELRAGRFERQFSITGGWTANFKDMPIYWRVNAPNNPLIIRRFTLILGVVEPGIDTENKSVDMIPVDHNDIPFDTLDV